MPAAEGPAAGSAGTTPAAGADDVLHADAVAALRGWAAPDAGQEALRAAYLAHLATRPDGLSRHCLAGHLTASALVVDRSTGRALLTLHRKLGRWLQLGGHCEPGDRTLAQAALREATEESGIPGLVLRPVPLRLDRHLVPCAGPGTSVAHLDVQYLALAAPGAVEQVSEESLQLRWFPLDGLPAGTDASVRALCADAARLLPTP
ncbi:NUDIX hydrolase [Motilibacter aurantiacus]|uniref:NUDIX hydrolase n=1 Tax=Motilibacter aurantiacus TaxID=2714955 RepID=UPI0014099B81|nr:NUDIX hydrolase [Motilibacter aurantiacus]NHC45645.1 NUDIX hydrolase [Motilibacter aurantiacus]